MNAINYIFDNNDVFLILENNQDLENNQKIKLRDCKDVWWILRENNYPLIGYELWDELIQGKI